MASPDRVRLSRSISFEVKGRAVGSDLPPGFLYLAHMHGETTSASRPPRSRSIIRCC